MGAADRAAGCLAVPPGRHPPRRKPRRGGLSRAPRGARAWPRVRRGARRDDPDGFATTFLGSSCAAIGTPCASGRSSAGFSCGCCPTTARSASMPTRGRSSIAGGGPTTGSRSGRWCSSSASSTGARSRSWRPSWAWRRGRWTGAPRTLAAGRGSGGRACLALADSQRVRP